MPKIRKAIIPVAGLGTRFLPATKAQPKEMLPIVDKPIIQYIVEEAVAAGIEEVIFVTSIGKRALEDHFDRNFELEYRLEQKKKLKELEIVAQIGKLAKFAFVRQAKPLGDGHAVLSALPFIGEGEPVAVLFGDDLVVGKKPALSELIAVYNRYNDPVIALKEVPHSEVTRFGVIDGKKVNGNVWEIRKFLEKPSVAQAPSNLAVVGKYILTPDILHMLNTTKPGKDGEIRIANAFESYIKAGRSLYGAVLTGRWYDCGNKLGFLTAQVELGLTHPELNGPFRNYLKKLKI
ncbi:UTP--glucose-1-phosphate uridylyltransferase [Candidatus Uhrbacteria bacterium RIFCSPLOWO2_01_FULL_47_24]|uniref:UTP--glucose-1-phosphate uridylyltransferase n=1 Tax=Candidatus Uhrbacteria bacterium RIFCSPLOWO2_01_FULL_47_24 TaxID=1802401 RepID=A0A1F7UUU6_9BACT|nr:MAG: UTP--glucose-1-phosphate uridylyltransferase [Candidatus Uhrbacteria bacterium RIFCSPHIGHO2_01_FULL_47_11]OGL69328.1 MAG: UTP--glucose-1-phosphate uridylyltransferase [Candidatus Uhrbacteria bacterium RIFCSPHIGHO2_02_FULL_46_47]OGL76398.1 MAG: UTP--glucose-1-phosphate uridylyltransferase [Candidatus Uhrbacteria bacterium RIFCSPHIGHO2_12_FULL_47_11]OGL82063.1 MAG: UTP--glucose-1-phosphate uridylyltransferase [Candidatus Uhrbacteria bacterium RIFCSPLOWO2_01_FULL_47_24]OGL85457.1 MAG: UTP-